MSEQISKVQRWLDLVAYLVGRRYPVPVEEIMRHVPAYAERWQTGEATAQATARRTFERDKDELRALGIAIETTRFTINYGLEEIEGYRIARRDFYLPELRLVTGAISAGYATSAAGGARGDRHRIADVELSEDDARAALDALRRIPDLPASPLIREARSAFRKLAFDLDPDHFLAAPILYAERPGTDTRLLALATLSDALLARKRVYFDYYAIHRDDKSAREVSPYGLFFQQGHWYLVGHDETRGERRIFRVDRMEAVRVNTTSPKSADFEVPADFSVAAYIERKPWELGAEEEAPLRAEVLFHPPASLWAARNGHGDLLEEHPDGSALRAFELRRADPFLRWILRLQGEAELVGPPGLVAELHALTRELAARYDAEVQADGGGDEASQDGAASHDGAMLHKGTESHDGAASHSGEPPLELVEVRDV